MSKWIEHFGDLLKFRGGREAKMCCLRREGVWEERGGKINATNGDKVLMALKNTKRGKSAGLEVSLKSGKIY